MTQIDESKISKLKSFNTHLDEKYGKPGTADRVEFNAKSIAYYYGVRYRNKTILVKSLVAPATRLLFFIILLLLQQVRS